MAFQKGVSGNPRGRPPKADKFARPIAAAEKRIADSLPLLVDKLLELAQGVTVQEHDQTGQAIIYTRAPDRQAAEYLLNRVMGKPTERTEVDETGSTTVHVVYQDTYAEPAETT